MWRLAVRIVSQGDTCRNSSIRGAWRLTARVPCQAVWKRVSHGDSEAVLGVDAKA